CLIALAAARTATTTGANRYVALAVAAAVFVHFTLSDAAYSGLLYSRNLLVTLLAVAWLAALDDRVWSGSRRTPWIAAAATGALVGLAVQTILPSFIDATAVAVAASLLLTQRVDDRARRSALRRTTAVAAVVAFVSAPVWYVVTGRFASFWASWWTYASYQYRGIGLSVHQELSRGAHTFYSYYRHRPLLFVMIAAFVCLTITEWLRFDRKTRIVHLSLLGWFCGGWFQLVSGERYSTHYFSVIAAPSAMIGAALAGHVYAALPTRWRITRTTPAWPLLAVILSFALSSGTTDRLISAASMTSNFTSIHRTVELERADQPGPDRSVQAVLDLVSRDRDPLLTYSDDQYLYPDYRRIPATRFQQRYFLIGSIYLGQTGPQYILHNTWTWFGEDLRHTNPAAFLKTEPVDSKPFVAYVSTHFLTVFSGSAGTVELRDDLARSVLIGATPQRWAPPEPPASGAGWTLDQNSAIYSGNTTPNRTPLPLTTHACERISGTLDNGTQPAPAVVFHINDRAGHQPELNLAFDGSYVSIEDATGALLDTVPIGTVSNNSTGTLHDGPLPFSLVIGRRAAALVIDGQIAGAVAVPHDPEITVEPAQSHLTLEGLNVGPPPPSSGC
ncbi:MAG TPA: hypothetical protein VK771_02345, partial [Acidimicrobiia bacterium]|nr:hypothetical protein [Acidimicrobiia bacterium]